MIGWPGTVRRRRASVALVAAVAAVALVVSGCSSTQGSSASSSAAASPSNVAVPNVVGAALDTASQALVSAGLLTGTITRQPSDKAPGTVVAQSPATGTEVAPGSQVDLVVAVSNNQTVVPDLSGKTAVDAANALSAAQLKVGTVTQQPMTGVTAGTIVAQNPNPGTGVEIGSAVNVTVAAGKPAVPDLTGTTQTSATEILKAVGLQLGTVGSQNSTRPPNTVVSQNPAAGAVVDPGTKVNVTLANGRVAVPNLVGQQGADAANTLLGASLTIGTVTRQKSSRPAGEVLSQNPAAGTVVALGSAVAVTVSDGKVDVPNVTGKTQSQASNILTGAGLALGTVTDQNSNAAPSTVLSQSPPPGQQVAPGTKVNVTVSNGLMTVPNVVGYTQAEATSTLQDVGFVVTVQAGSGGTPGTVVQQQPAAGSQLARGKTVVITVSAS